MPTEEPWGPTRIDRPHMPGYGLEPVGEGDGLLPWEQVRGKLRAARNYWISTSSPAGEPHAAPVWGLWVEDAFYFATGADSRKGRNLAHNPSAVVHLESGDEVVILVGGAQVCRKERKLTELNAEYQEKYGVDITGGVVYRFKARKAYAWSEEEFPSSATRWHF